MGRHCPSECNATLSVNQHRADDLSPCRERDREREGENLDTWDRHAGFSFSGDTGAGKNKTTMHTELLSFNSIKQPQSEWFKLMELRKEICHQQETLAWHPQGEVLMYVHQCSPFKDSCRLRVWQVSQRVQLSACCSTFLFGDLITCISIQAGI